MGRSHASDAIMISVITESPMDQAISLKSGKIDHACEAWYDSLQAARPLLVVISGPSGVGKDVTIRLMKEQAFPFYFVVTATTRPRRAGEVDGVDYHFVSEAAFKQMIADGELLEHALVYGQYKGIPKAGVRTALASGQDVIMRIDVQGAATVRKLVPQAVTVFLVAESIEELERRLRNRRSEPPDVIATRIEKARAEMARAGEFDYVVVNRRDRLEDTVDVILAVITAAKHSTRREPIVL